MLKPFKDLFRAALLEPHKLKQLKSSRAATAAGGEQESGRAGELESRSQAGSRYGRAETGVGVGGGEGAHC